MKYESLRQERRDEIDHIVDDLLADPSRAAEAKRQLRRALEAGSPDLRLVPTHRGSDADDLWDNVPV